MKKNTNKFLLLPLQIMLVLITHHVFSQTGPGGVGNSTTNVLWLKANDLALSDDADISTWTDASGNSNDFSQPNSSFTPVFKTGILNGLPVVRFEKTNNRIRRNSFTNFPTNALTAIYVNKNNAESQDGVFSYYNAVDNEFAVFNSNSLRIIRGATRISSTGVVVNDNEWNITNIGWRGLDGNLQIWKNGINSYSNTLASGTAISSGGTFAIGNDQDTLDGNYDEAQTHSGDFSEVIIYNTFLNEAEQIIVSNYLAAKYNLNISNDYFSFESTHSHDLAGIGRVDLSNTHTSAMSDFILQVENPSELDSNNEFLFFGHDNGDIETTWSTSEAPNNGEDIQRLAREWRFNETGEFGTVDFRIDVSSLPTLPAMHTMYVLMVDSDGDFTQGTSIYELSLDSGTEFTSTSIDISDGDFVAIGVINPKVEHDSLTSSESESNNAIISVSLNFIPKVNRTLEITTSAGSATPGVGNDYTEEINTTVTILAGDLSSTYSIIINDDGDAESTENFTITLSNPSSGINLGDNIIHTYSINDNDNSRKVNFDTSTANNSEDTTPINVSLSLTSLDLTNPTSVDYSVTGGTATNGSDYIFSSGTITFPATTTTNSFSFTVDDDSVKESNETIIITLSNPVNCNIGETDTFTYTINDNDANPTIEFTSISSTNSETTTSVNFQVELNDTSGVDTFINYALSGSAVEGSDYILSAGVLTIPSGNLTANINATIVNDSEVELDETIILTLSNPINSILGDNNIHTYTITNDDSFGNSGPGGVGDSSTNLFWLRAEDLSLDDNDDILSWVDNSGNSNDLTQESSSLAPTFISSELNGYPIVRFNKTNNRIRRNTTTFPTNEITTFYVGKTTDSGDGILSYSSGASQNDFLLLNSDNLRFDRGSNSTTSGISFNDNNWHVNSLKWRSLDGNYEIWKDGNVNSGTNASGSLITSGGTFAIGGDQDSVDGGYQESQAHSGDFAEVIIYNSYLNKAQQIIISNYLAAKYNITLSENHLVPVAAAGYYYEDVTGIGQADDGSFHVDSEGSGIVRIDSPSDLGNDEFLFIGREVETPASKSKENKESQKKMVSYSFSTNTSGNYRERINSRWRVRRRNNLGTVRIWINLNGVDLSEMPSCSTLELVVGSNRNLLTTTRYPLIEYGGGYYYANNVSFSNNDYFSVEFTDKIVLNGTQFLNGSGDSNRPNTSDDCFKLLVTSDATGSLIQNEDANVREIEVEAGGHLVVGDGNRIQVSDGIVVDGDIRLVGSAQVLRTSGTNNVSGTGSLYRDQESISTTVYQSGYWSSPVTTNGSTYTISGVLKDGSVATTAVALAGSALDINFTDVSVLDGSKTTPITISGKWLAKLVNATDWTREIDPSSEVFNPGEGWNMKTTGGGAQNFTFVGIPNDGTYTSSIDQGRLSLLGNPYPSALDADTFIADNTSSITGTLYFYNAGNDSSHNRSDYTGGYATRVSGMGTAFSGGSAPARYIPIGQGFFVTREASGTGTVTFQNSQRAFETVGGSSLFYSKSRKNIKKTSENNFPILKLGFEFDIDDSKKYHRQLAVGFRGLSSDFETGFDAEMFDRQPSDLALTVSDKDSPFVILGTEYYNEDIEIPLILNLDKDREVTFKLDEVLNLNASIYIYDNVQRKTYKISDSPLTLNLSLGEYNDRFSIIFKDRTSIALDVDDEIIKNGISIYQNNETKELVIKSNQGVVIDKMSIFNLLGQEVKSLKINNQGNEIRIKTDTIKSNLYIIKLKTDKGLLSKKILLK